MNEISEQETTTVTLTIDGIAPIEFDCYIDNPVFLDICNAWSEKDRSPDLVIHLQLGPEDEDNLYFPVSKLIDFHSTTPVSPEMLMQSNREIQQIEPDSFQLSDTWVHWVEQNLKLGKDVATLYRYMLDHGVDDWEITRLTGYKPSIEPDISERDDREPVEPLSADEMLTEYRINSDYIELYEIKDFFSATECEYLLSLITDNGERSVVDMPMRVSELRTSNTFRFSNDSTADPLIRKSQMRMARLLGTDLKFAEPATILIYNQGQRFRAHRDYYKGDDPEYQSVDGAMRSGQRKWSSLVYLNDTDVESGTRFHRLRQLFSPKKGSALIWNNLYPSGRANPYSQHSGLPVGAKGKLVYTQMFRT